MSGKAARRCTDGIEPDANARDGDWAHLLVSWLAGPARARAEQALPAAGRQQRLLGSRPRRAAVGVMTAPGTGRRRPARRR